MKRRNAFLTAEWRNILMFNYAVDPGLLGRFVPAGTELDVFEGKTWLSLVAFEFRLARVLGFRIPFHQAFEEVNLRFYVRRARKRGVVFIRELVPKYAVAAVARLAFGENYSRTRMSHRVQTGSGGYVAAEYSFGAGRNRCRMELETEGPGLPAGQGSFEQFITEHYWGYVAQRGGCCLEYEVRHPPWRVWHAGRASFSGSTVGIYGPEVSQVLMRVPECAFLCEGSSVEVFKGVEVCS